MLYWGLCNAFLLGMVTVFIRKGFFTLVFVKDSAQKTAFLGALLLSMTTLLPVLELVAWGTNLDGARS